jgi:non-ribosomal peptide synthetase component E (peptide arylation enzyme)
MLIMHAVQMTSSPAADRYLQQGWWRNQTLLEYFDRAVRQTPAKTAVVGPGGVRLSFGELGKLVERVAAGLVAAGVGKGDVVSIQLPNCAEFVVVHLAANRLGAVTNPLLPTYRAKELGYILARARTKVVVVPAEHRRFDFQAMYRDLLPVLPELSAVYVVGGHAREGMCAYEALLAQGEFAGGAELDGNDLAALIFTSGTESSPKGVMHTHNTMMYATLEMAGLLGLTSEDVVWVPSPIGHGTGFLWGVRQAITLGATVVLQDAWDVDEALRLIEQERCSFVLSATPFVAMLLESPKLAQHDLSSLRIFACAGATIPRQMGERARQQIGCTLIGMWGMSECFVGSASAPTDPDDKLWASDGRAMPGAELAIFDDDHKQQLPPGEVGELATRGPHVALGYFNDPERTAAAFSAEGWLFSGDLATIDPQGYIRIVGRKKDIINRGGLKISAREIEDLILEHPKVARVAVVPLPDARLGEKCCACVVTRDDAQIGLAELTSLLLERGVATYKLPEFVALLHDFPMTPSGKVQKFRLRDDILVGRIATAPPYAGAS